MMTRRDVMRAGFLASLSTLIYNPTAAFAQPASTGAQAPAGPFKLPPLGYAFDALEPYIDARTMEIHHDKHHAAYVANLNKAVSNLPKWKSKTVEELIFSLDKIPEGVRVAIRNNAGGHFNHTFFWPTLKKNGGGKPSGELMTAINKAFGSYDAFKERFTAAALGVFGSGWAWLSVGPDKKLAIRKTQNQDTVLPGGNKPILGIDVWEHAYYLKYQNRRQEYVAAFYNVIDWDVVTERLRKAG